MDPKSNPRNLPKQNCLLLLIIRVKGNLIADKLAKKATYINLNISYSSVHFIGHFNSYFARFHIKDNDKCDCGVTGKQNYYHLIYDCDHYNNQWNKLMQTVINEGLNWPCLEKDYL